MKALKSPMMAIGGCELRMPEGEVKLRFHKIFCSSGS